jgi:hypothetical protein
LWDTFDESEEMRTWKPNLSSEEYRADAFPPLEVVATLATYRYNLGIRVYVGGGAGGGPENIPLASGGGDADFENGGGGVKEFPAMHPDNETIYMTLQLGRSKDLCMIVKHNPLTGKNTVPTKVVNILDTLPRQTGTADMAGMADMAGTLSEKKSAYSLAVYDTRTRAHMLIRASFIGAPRSQFMNFDLHLSNIQPTWQFILKGCSDLPVFIFAMRTESGARHASYIAHWPVDMVAPYITLDEKKGDDGLIIVPLASNNLEEAKRIVVADHRCIIDS